eukprot:jgi/Hompol1/6367/HPOL_004953-RA
MDAGTLIVGSTQQVQLSSSSPVSTASSKDVSETRPAIPSSATRRGVTFGPPLKPEIFDFNNPPSTPIVRGQTPPSAYVATTSSPMRSALKRRGGVNASTGLSSMNSSQLSSIHSSPLQQHATRRTVEEPPRLDISSVHAMLFSGESNATGMADTITAEPDAETVRLMDESLAMDCMDDTEVSKEVDHLEFIRLPTITDVDLGGNAIGESADTLDAADSEPEIPANVEPQTGCLSDVMDTATTYPACVENEVTDEAMTSQSQAMLSGEFSEQQDQIIAPPLSDSVENAIEETRVEPVPVVDETLSEVAIETAEAAEAPPNETLPEMPSQPSADASTDVVMDSCDETPHNLAAESMSDMPLAAPIAATNDAAGESLTDSVEDSEVEINPRRLSKIPSDVFSTSAVADKRAAVTAASHPPRVLSEKALLKQQQRKALSQAATPNLRGLKRMFKTPKAKSSTSIDDFFSPLRSLELFKTPKQASHAQRTLVDGALPKSATGAQIDSLMPLSESRVAATPASHAAPSAVQEIESVCRTPKTHHVALFDVDDVRDLLASPVDIRPERLSKSALDDEEDMPIKAAPDLVKASESSKTLTPRASNSAHRDQVRTAVACADRNLASTSSKIHSTNFNSAHSKKQRLSMSVSRRDTGATTPPTVKSSTYPKSAPTKLIQKTLDTNTSMQCEPESSNGASVATEIAMDDILPSVPLKTDTSATVGHGSDAGITNTLDDTNAAAQASSESSKDARIAPAEEVNDTTDIPLTSPPKPVSSKKQPHRHENDSVESLSTNQPAVMPKRSRKNAAGEDNGSIQANTTKRQTRRAKMVPAVESIHPDPINNSQQPEQETEQEHHGVALDTHEPSTGQPIESDHSEQPHKRSSNRPKRVPTSQFDESKPATRGKRAITHPATEDAPEESQDVPAPKHATRVSQQAPSRSKSSRLLRATESAQPSVSDHEDQDEDEEHAHHPHGNQEDEQMVESQRSHRSNRSAQATSAKATRKLQTQVAKSREVHDDSEMADLDGLTQSQTLAPQGKTSRISRSASAPTTKANTADNVPHSSSSSGIQADIEPSSPPAAPRSRATRQSKLKHSASQESENNTVEDTECQPSHDIPESSLNQSRSQPRATRKTRAPAAIETTTTAAKVPNPIDVSDESDALETQQRLATRKRGRQPKPARSTSRKSTTQGHVDDQSDGEEQQTRDTKQELQQAYQHKEQHEEHEEDEQPSSQTVATRRSKKSRSTAPVQVESKSTPAAVVVAVNSTTLRRARRTAAK